MDEAEIREMWKYVHEVIQADFEIEEPDVEARSLLEICRAANRIHERAIERSGLNSLDSENKIAKLNNMIKGLDGVVDKALKHAQIFDKDVENEYLRAHYIANGIAVHMVIFRLKQLLQSLQEVPV